MRKYALLAVMVVALVFASVAAAGGCYRPAPPASQLPHANDIWLCQGVYQQVPANFDSAQALQLVALDGYVQAVAVAGNVVGGNNVGAYHLVCNSKLKANGFYVGDGGDVYGVDYSNYAVNDTALIDAGFYAVVQ